MDRMGIEDGEVITAGMITRAISSAQQKVEVRNFGVRKHLLEYDDVMNQQRQVVYDIRNQALSGKNMRDTVAQIIEDYIVDEIEEQSETESLADWDWDSLRQNLSSHLLVDISHQKLIEDAGREEWCAGRREGGAGEDARECQRGKGEDARGYPSGAGREG